MPASIGLRQPATYVDDPVLEVVRLSQSAIGDLPQRRLMASRFAVVP
jgi:hypothetical protein